MINEQAGSPQSGPERNQFGEKPEFSFEDGAREALRRILALYENTDHDLIILINGSGPNVGKTFLHGLIGSELTRLGIPVSQMHDSTRTELARREEEEFRTAKRDAQKNFGVYFLSHKQGATDAVARSYAEAMRRDPESLHIDIALAVDRPDKPFTESPWGDIIIHNELARDDPRKYHG